MALLKTGSLLFKTLRPVGVNPIFVIPSSLSVQSRNAARKGYRLKALLKKKELKMAAKPQKKKLTVVRTVGKGYHKSEERSLPDLPNDDIILLDNFKYMKFSLSDAVKLHREYHHPTLFNNPEAFVQILVEFNLVGKKATQFVKPFKGVAAIPHPFRTKKEVLVFCEPEDAEELIAAGASSAGGADLIKKIQEGIIVPNIYDYVISHVNFFPQLHPIRGLLGNLFPKARLGTITNDLKAALFRFLNGSEYECLVTGGRQDFGTAEIVVGNLAMDLNHLEENFKAVLAELMIHKPPREGEFISWIWCQSLPSKEKFSIDLSKYIESSDQTYDEDDDDDDDNKKSAKKEEYYEIRKLREQVESG